MATEINLAGKTGPEIALLVVEGKVSQEEAEKFVQNRALSKFWRALEKANAETP